MKRPGARLVLVLAVASIGCAGARPTTLGSSGSGLAPCPESPNCVSTSASSEQHGLAPYTLALPVSAAWPAIEQAVTALPGTVVVTSTPGYLHAESTSRLMRYVDDLEIRVSASGGEQLEVRSASRVGYGDMGVNRARADALRAALREAGVIR